jgi:toxin ParE1/3/4
MPTFRYTRQAEKELASILAHTKNEWGEAQAQKYFQELADTFHLLARYQQMGRIFSESHRTWRRFEQGSHVIIYRSVADGIVIQRLLHNRQHVPHTKLS